jgi:hypothetical protein
LRKFIAGNRICTKEMGKVMKRKALSGAIPVMATIILVLSTSLGASATSLSDLAAGSSYWDWTWNNELLGQGHQSPRRTIDSGRYSSHAALIYQDLTNNVSHFTSCRSNAELPVEHTNRKFETPEPSTLLLLGLGLMGIASYRRFKNKRKGR